MALALDAARDRGDVPQERQDRRRLHASTGGRRSSRSRRRRARSRSGRTPSSEAAAFRRRYLERDEQQLRAQRSRRPWVPAAAGRGARACTSCATGSRYGSQADSALAAQGHGYLDSLAPWLVLLLGLALGTFLARFGAGARRPSRLDAAPLVRRALAALDRGRSSRSTPCRSCSKACSPPGIRPGFAGLFGHGGWWSLAASVVVGALAAACSGSPRPSSPRRCGSPARPGAGRPGGSWPYAALRAARAARRARHGRGRPRSTADVARPCK